MLELRPNCYLFPPFSTFVSPAVIDQYEYRQRFFSGSEVLPSATAVV